MEEILMCNACGFQGEINDFDHDSWDDTIICPACGEVEIINTEDMKPYAPKTRW